MSGKQKRSLVLLLALVALLIAGCSSSSGPEPAPQEAPAPESMASEEPVAQEPEVDRWQLAQSSGTLVVGTSADYPPFEYYTPDFKLDGFDIALMREIGDLLGLKIQFIDMAFDGLGDALQLGQIDSAISAISVTPAREDVVDFSGIYYIGQEAILASETSDIETIDTIDDLVGMRIGVGAGSVYEDWLVDHVVATGVISANDLFVYGDTEQAVDGLIAGDIDLVFLDAAPAKTFVDRVGGQLQLRDSSGETLLTFAPTQLVPLENTEWLLLGYNAGGEAVSVPDAIDITAVFSEGSLSGSGGCNDFQTSYELDGANIAIAPIASTMMACPEPIMAAEQAYLAALAETASYDLEGETLTLMNAEGEPVLVYGALPALDIDNVIWTLGAYGQPGSLQTPLPGTEITLLVSADGSVSGSAGCNQYDTKVTIEGDAVSFAPAATTRKACEDPVNAQEITYLNGLTAVTRAELQAGQLILSNDDGSQVLMFSPSKLNPLAGTEWSLSVFGDPATGDPVVGGSDLTLLFATTDQLGGFAGCNNFNGGYQLDGDALSIGPLASTLTLCSVESLNQQEQAYLAALGATASYDLLGVKIVGGGLSDQEYAIAVAEGETSLRVQLNGALAELENTGRIAELAELYLGVEPGDLIPPPTPEPPTPEPECIDGMKWVADLTYDDHNMTDPPLLQPGEDFTKVWRIKNIGTCTWTSAYYLDYVNGNTNASRMGGERTFVDGPVNPDAKYDMALDLTAPTKPGVYQGFWQMFNSSGKGFGPKLWVGIRVPAAPTPTPVPTATPSPEVSFWADSTQIKQGQCTTLHWQVENVQEVYLYPQGEDWRNYGVEGKGSQTVCPAATTTYLLRILFRDDSVQELPLTIYVEPAANAPEIQSFTVEPPYNILVGECVVLRWSVVGDVNTITLARNNAPIWNGAPLRGSYQDCPPGAGTITYGLIAEGRGGVSRAVQRIDVIPVGPTETPEPPTPTPEPTLEPPTPTPEPTLVPPTETPEPTPEPTLEPPTATPEPPTPEPTLEPPTPTPEPPEPTPEPTTPPPGSDLLGSWLLESWYQGKAAPQPPLPGTTISAQFMPDGQVTGTAGCNTYSGTYQTDGVSLTISPLVVSQQICAEPEGVMEQETAYLNFLQTATGYMVDAGRLQILSNGGQNGLNYLAQ